MFAEMRRQDRLLSQEEAVAILDRGSHGILSLHDTSGYPYGVPVSYVYHDGRIYLHCARGAGQKAKDLAADPRVCFTVVGQVEVMPEKFGAKYESVIAFGRARELEGEDKQAALEQIIGKYSAAYRDAGLQYIANAFEKTGVYEITVERLTGKAKRQ